MPLNDDPISAVRLLDIEHFDSRVKRSEKGILLSAYRVWPLPSATPATGSQVTGHCLRKNQIIPVALHNIYRMG